MTPSQEIKNERKEERPKGNHSLLVEQLKLKMSPLTLMVLFQLFLFLIILGGKSG